MSTAAEITADTQVILDCLRAKYTDFRVVSVDSNKMAYDAAADAGFDYRKLTMVSERGYKDESGRQFKRWFFALHCDHPQWEVQ